VTRALIVGIDARPAVWHRGTGIGNYTHQLVEHLKALESPNLYRLAWPAGEPLPDLPAGWNASPVPRDRRAEGPALARWLRDEGVQVYHVPQNGIHSPPDLGQARLVVTIHDLIPWVLPECVSASYMRRFLREVPTAAARASAVITVSERTKSDLVRILGVEKQKIHLVYPGPEEVFRPVPPPVAEVVARGKYGLSGPYAIYVGGLNFRKNVQDLLYAFSKVCRGLIPQLRLLVAGDPQSRHLDVTGFARLTGLVDYLVAPGDVPLEDLPALYSAATMAVYPSLFEGFGLPPLEAMACGTPVICSDAGALPEVVGRAALRVPAGDVSALARAIQDLAADGALRDRLRRRGLKRVARFSWRRAVLEIVGVYEAVAAQEEKPPG